jgi:sortase (surface protein transpeptidase)
MQPRHDRRVVPTVRRVTTVVAAFLVATVLAVGGWANPEIVAVPGMTAVAAAPTTTLRPSSSPTPAVAPVPGTAPRSGSLTPVRIAVPAIGVRATLVRLGLTASGALAVPTTAAAAGWYRGSPVPGRIGPSVIAGHVHWSGVPGVFARLTELHRGDRIMVTRSDGSVVTFTVDSVATYAKSRFPTALVYGPLAVAGLRLITCGGYDASARSYEANVIVFATRAAG